MYYWVYTYWAAMESSSLIKPENWFKMAEKYKTELEGSSRGHLKRESYYDLSLMSKS